MGATLDGIGFPFDPNQFEWGYATKTNVVQTLGGRVIQLLSLQIKSINWQGDAGSEANLLKLFDQLSLVLDRQVESGNPSTLSVPSKGWSFKVYLDGLSGFSWTKTTVTYPYSLRFLVDSGHGSIYTSLRTRELERLSEDFGRIHPAFSGPDGYGEVVERLSEAYAQ